MISSKTFKIANKFFFPEKDHLTAQAVWKKDHSWQLRWTSTRGTSWQLGTLPTPRQEQPSQLRTRTIRERRLGSIIQVLWELPVVERGKEGDTFNLLALNLCPYECEPPTLPNVLSEAGFIPGLFKISHPGWSDTEGRSDAIVFKDLLKWDVLLSSPRLSLSWSRYCVMCNSCFETKIILSIDHNYCQAHAGAQAE